MPLADAFPQTLKAARAGDPAAWELMYRAHAPAVMGFLRSQHRLAAEDICSDTFAGACRDIHQFSGSNDDLRRWLLSIARNRLIDLRRAEQARPASADVDMPDQVFAEVGFEQAEKRVDSQHRVESMLDGLGADQRAVLYLRFVLDLDQRDVAAVLGMSLASVKMAQLRGSRKLAQRLSNVQELQ